MDDRRSIQSDNDNLPWMNQWLKTDSDSPSLVLQCLDWSSMAALYNTCTTWVSYFCQTSHRIATGEHELRLRMISKAALACRCNLLRRHLRRIQLKLTSRFDLVVFDHVPLLFQITHLEIAFRQSMVSSYLFELAALLPNLRILRMDHDGSNERPDWAKRVDPSFAALERLKDLEEFRLDHACYFCQKSHVEELLRCKSLTSLDCGRWLSDHRKDMDYDRTRQMWIEECITQLHRLPNLQYIGLGPPPAFKGEGNLLDGTINNDVWVHLAKCTSLTDLSHVNWHEDIGENWKLLMNFTKLQKFSYPRKRIKDTWKTDGDHIPPPIQMWSALIRCTSITQLTLGWMKLTSPDMTELFSSLPLLTELRLHDMVLASLEPFADATRLERLTLLHCTDCDKAAFLYHVALPPMPHLRYCCLENRWPRSVERPTHDQIERTGQLLGARFPMALVDFRLRF